MKCPNCSQEFPVISCQECGEGTPEGANYCMACGVGLMSESEDFQENGGEFDFEDRVLCPDGTCTGIIINGKCTECEKPPGAHKKETE